MSKLQMKGKQKGFTIIELVVVILLLGILTATALPRFIDVTDEAHEAVVSGVLGGVGTGAALFRAQWFANGQATTVSEFNNLWANSTGYPIGIKSGTVTTTLLSTVGSSTRCQQIFQNVLQASGQPTITTMATAATGPSTLGTLTSGSDFVAYLQSGNSTQNNTCYYFYTGRFNRPLSQTVPAIVYNARTGSVTSANY